jgi:hypothetical protein
VDGTTVGLLVARCVGWESACPDQGVAQRRDSLYAGQAVRCGVHAARDCGGGTGDSEGIDPTDKEGRGAEKPWASAVPASAPLAAATTGPIVAGAPVGGRVCQTGIRLAPEVTETIVAYDDAHRTLTYQAAGLPAFVTTARSTWSVAPFDGRRSVVTVRARFDTRGPLGVFAGWALRLQARTASRALARDLAQVLEHGTPSPRKLRQLQGDRRAG